MLVKLCFTLSTVVAGLECCVSANANVLRKHSLGKELSLRLGINDEHNKWRSRKYISKKRISSRFGMACEVRFGVGRIEAFGKPSIYTIFG